MIKENKSPAQIFEWVEETIPEDLLNDPSFSRELMHIILQRIAGSPSQYSPESLAKSLESFAELLVGLFANNLESLQVNPLLEIQSFCFNLNFPKGLLEQLFKDLCKLQIIQQNSYLEWMQTNEPGKKEALAQVRKWLDSLKEDVKD